jgi:hypothetical protein
LPLARCALDPDQTTQAGQAFIGKWPSKSSPVVSPRDAM